MTWNAVVRIIGGVWTVGRLDVVIHDHGLMLLWVRDHVVCREWNWRTA